MIGFIGIAMRDGDMICWANLEGGMYTEGGGTLVYPPLS